MSTSLVLLFW